MAYFVPEFDTQSRRACLQWARDDYDGYDAWGWCMSWLFDIAGELETRGEEVPPELDYRAGALGPEVSEDRADGLADLSTESLQHAARVFHRLADRIRARGEDY